MWIAVLIALIVIVAAYLIYNSLSNASPKKHSRHSEVVDIPAKVGNPLPYKNIKSIVAWEFVAPNLSTACEFARNNAGVRKQADDCTALPLAACGGNACLCYYRPVLEQRKKARRVSPDRRTSMRFDTSEDRRKEHDRRKDQPDWNENLLK